MRVLSLGLLVLATACAPSMTPDHVKSADEQIADQERAQAEAERDNKPGSGDVDTKEIDEEQKKKFDQRQAEIELKRATRSAETCPGAIGEKDQPKGDGEVSLVFANDGHVKTATIGAPFEGTKVGKCALRAFEAVIVPPFVGGEQPINWKVDLTGNAPSADKKKPEKEEGEKSDEKKKKK